MKYNAQLVESLSAEYVLGTLQAAARRRFDRLIVERADVRFAVWRWERRLNGFATILQPQQPSRRVWKNIRRRVETPLKRESAIGRWWSRPGFALPAALAVAWLVVNITTVDTTDRIAVFSDASSETLWVVSVDLDGQQLQTKSVSADISSDATDYELWVLPLNGQPRSLGVLEVGSDPRELAISDDIVEILGTASKLAISLEPAGGSLTGLPSGPVIYQASLISI